MFDKNALNKKILDLHKQYCEFANIENPADMIIDYWNNADFSVSIGNPSMLHVNGKLLDLLWNKVIPTLYHEFTHLNDDNTYFLYMPLRERAVALKPFTEIHATEIEIKVALGFNNINDIPTISADTSFISLKRSITTLEKYLKYANNVLKKALDKYEDNPSRETLRYALDETFYGIGRFRFVRRHITELQYTATEVVRAGEIFGESMNIISAMAMRDEITTGAISIMSEEWKKILWKNGVHI